MDTTQASPAARPLRRFAAIVLAVAAAAPAAAQISAITVPAGQGYTPATHVAAAAPLAAKAVARVTADDATDPAVVAKADALGHDPARLFAFVRDEVGIDPYAGSLRGARGTLSGLAGNSLDRASLAVALLRASGFAARHAQGSLSYEDAQKIVTRAFPPAQRLVGCNNPGGQAFAASDYWLVTPTMTHTWAQYQATSGGPWIDFDPTFADAVPGHAYTTPTATFDNVPDVQKHHVRVRLDAETYSQAGAMYGFGLSTTTVLDVTLATADVVDRPLTIGHFVARNAPPSLAIGAITTTYSPYLLVGDSRQDPADYLVQRGADYTQIATNFPLGTTLVTGVFANIDVIAPQGQPQSYQRVLADIIGYATRVNGGSVAAPSSDAPPLITPLDFTTLLVAGAKQPLDTFAARQGRLASLQAQAAALAPAIAALPPAAQQTPAQVSQRIAAADLNRRAVIAVLELATASFEGAAARVDEDAAATFVTRAWIESPRLTIATSRVADDALRFALDIRKNDLRVYPLTGIAWLNAAHYERARGLQESLLEAQVLAAVTGDPVRSAADLFAPGAPDLVPITRYDVTRVDDLALSDESKARIRDALTGQPPRSVIAPRAPVTAGGTPYTVWLESDPNTGYTISTGEDGTHQALGEYAGLLLQLFGVDSLETQMAKFIGRVNAVGVVGVAFTAAVVQAAASNSAFVDLAHAIKQFLNDSSGPLEKVINLLEESGASEFCEGGCGLVQSMLSGLVEGIKTFRDAIGAGDPPVPVILTAPPLPPLPGRIAPGASPGVTLDVVRDVRWFVPYNGAELPFVYLLKITNTGPARDTFRIDNHGTAGYYGFQPAASTITLDAGASGEVGLCLLPNGPLPAAGTSLPFGVTVSSPANPGATATHDGVQATPAATALALRVAPDNATAQAGETRTTTLTLDSLGNTNTNVALTTASDAGLTVEGLPGNLALAAGESRSLPLTMRVGGGAASGDALVSTLRGNFGGVFPAATQYTVNVTSPLTACTSRAAVDATHLGRTTMGAALVRLAAAMDRLAGHPDDGDARADALGQLGELVANQLGSTYLAPVRAPLTGARDQLANASTAGVAAALTAIDTALCPLGAALRDAATGDLALSLDPQLAVNLPTQAVTVKINLYNDTAAPRTFDVAISGLPPTVQATLSATRITLPPRYQSNGCCGSPTLSVSFVNTDGQARAFDYRVTVTPTDLPDISRGVTGSLALRNDILRIASVRATPLAVEPGAPVNVGIRVMNSSNGTRHVYAGWLLRDSTGTARRSGGTDAISLAPGDAIVPIPDFAIDTTGLNGTYTVEAALVDTDRCCDPVPGASAVGAFLVGQPFSAKLSVTPASVAPGTSALAYSLDLAHESAPTPVIDARASLPMAASTRSLTRRGHYLYVCQSNRISIVDIAVPNTPTLVGDFATDVLGIGYSSVGCNLDGDVLVLAYNLSSPSSFDDLKLVAYRIDDAHATAPQQLNAVPVTVPKRFGSEIRFNASHQGSLTTSAILYNPFSGFIFQQNGNLIGLDFSTPAAPVQTGELFHHFGAGDTNDPIYGGPSQIFTSLPRGSTTLLATTTAVGDGFGTGPGVGRLTAVNIGQLATHCAGSPNPCISGATDVPEARLLFGLAAQGNAGLAAGDTDGQYDGRSGGVGFLTLSALDLAGALPVVRSTQVTLMRNRREAGGACNQPLDIGGTSLTALSGNYYAVGAFNPLTCSWVLGLVDANDTAHLRIIPYDVPSVLRTTLLDGGKLYALTDTAILVYDYSVIAGPAITARVDIPKGTGVAVTPASFNVAPTSIDTGNAAFDRYTWYRPAATNITWQGTVSGLLPGELRDVALGGGVDFTLPEIGAGTVALERASVSADQAVAIAPARQGGPVGEPFTYTITLKNAGNAPVAYDLALVGVPQAWKARLDTPVTVPAHGQATSTLVLQTLLSDRQYADWPFTVTATTPAFATSAQAVLQTAGRDIGPDANNAVYASTLAVPTTAVQAGRGDVAPFAARTANVGNSGQSYTIYVEDQPSGISVSFLGAGYWMNAGATRDIQGQVQASRDLAPGIYPVRIRLNSYGAPVTATFNVEVPGPGVELSISPFSGTPTSSYTATVRNTGTAADTFDLSALGALGPAAVLAPASLTIDAGATQTASVTLANTGYLPPGTATFDVQAVSRALPAARARATAQVTLPPRRAVALTGAPAATTSANLPATASFGLRLANNGNSEDVYSLAVVGSTGAVTAALRDAAGNAVQTIAPLRVPGNGTAQARLDATLAAGGSETGSVSVRATSQSDGAVTATAVLTFSRNGAPNIVMGTPGSLDFGNQALGTTSDVKSVTLVNSGVGDFAIASVAITGANTGDFAAANGVNACSAGGTIAANGGSCTVYATFAPLATGARSASIDVNGSGGATIAIPASGNGVDVTHLGAEIGPNRPFVQYGRLLSYLVTTRNPGATATTGVNVSLPLPAQFDPSGASWFCINANDPGVTCRPSGSGSLADTNVRVPAQGNISYLVTAPVRTGGIDEHVDATVTVSSTADPTPRTATAHAIVVLFKNGFEPFGDGASGTAPVGALDGNDVVLLHVADDAGLAFVDTVLSGRASNGEGFRIERLGSGARRWVRLVAEPRAGLERAGAWIAVPADGMVALSLVEGDGDRTVLLAAGDATSRVSVFGEGAFALAADEVRNPGRTP